MRGWNTICTLEDLSDPGIVGALRTMAPGMFGADGQLPPEQYHRKCWEEAMTYLGLHHFGAVREDAEILAVAAGHELVTYYLTNEVRWVFSTDLYGEGDFSGAGDTAALGMLRTPQAFAHPALPAWRPGRLVVEHMDALALRADDATFDAAYSQSSIEHMGGFAGAMQAVREMGRVVRPGGVVAVATECCVNGAPSFETPGFSIFTPAQFAELAECSPHLEPVEPFSLSGIALDASLVLDLGEQVKRQNEGRGVQTPHVLLRDQGRVFTSGMLFFRRLG